jgi:hypothetical protein
MNSKFSLEWRFSDEDGNGCLRPPRHGFDDGDMVMEMDYRTGWLFHATGIGVDIGIDLAV